jgi:hypothetical protein
MRRVLLTSALTAISVVQASATSRDDHTSFYSWRPKGQPWHFGFFSESKLPKTEQEIKHPEEVIVGVPELKKRLLRFRRGQNLTWRDDPPAFTYPPFGLVEDVRRFARQRGVYVELNPAIECPAASNQPLQPTAGRSDASREIMKTPPLQSTLALASGG